MADARLGASSTPIPVHVAPSALRELIQLARAGVAVLQRQAAADLAADRPRLAAFVQGQATAGLVTIARLKLALERAEAEELAR